MIMMQGGMGRAFDYTQELVNIHWGNIFHFGTNGMLVEEAFGNVSPNIEARCLLYGKSTQKSA